MDGAVYAFDNLHEPSVAATLIAQLQVRRRPGPDLQRRLAHSGAGSARCGSDRRAYHVPLTGGAAAAEEEIPFADAVDVQGDRLAVAQNEIDWLYDGWRGSNGWQPQGRFSLKADAPPRLGVGACTTGAVS